jgi:autotransporter-associated beta strand protein
MGLSAENADRSLRNDIVFLTTTNYLFYGYNLTLGGTVTLGSLDLNFVVSNSFTAFTNVISGGTSGKTLTKSGPGNLIFSGINTYTIPTIINEGKLLANNLSGSATGTGTVTINAGGILGGTGIVSGAVSGSGQIAPGSIVGKLTMQNGLDLSSGTMVWELGALKDDVTGLGGTDFDQVALTGGNLNLDGSSTLSINFTNSATAPNSSNPFWQSTRTWKIVDVSGSGSNTGSTKFANLVNASYSAGSFTNFVSGGNVILQFVPDPSAVPAPTVSGSITGAGTANASISWSAKSGVNYQLQYKDDLNLTNWLVLGNVTATTNTASLPDTTGPVPHRFYRVVVP